MTETYTGYGHNMKKSTPAAKKSNFVGPGKSLVGDFTWDGKHILIF